MSIFLMFLLLLDTRQFFTDHNQQVKFLVCFSPQSLSLFDFSIDLFLGIVLAYQSKWEKLWGNGNLFKLRWQSIRY